MIAIPIIIQGIVFQLQSLTDKVFLGNIQTKYLSVLGNTMLPYQATLEVVVAICTGLTILVAYNYGSNNEKEIEHQISASISYNSLITCSLFLIWFFFSKYIFMVMGVTSNLLEYCTTYVSILSVYLIIFGADLSIQAALQGLGITKPIMYVGICKVTINIVLDWILIFGHLGFPTMDIKGAAIATTIANIFSGLCLIIYIFASKKVPVNITLKKLLCFNWQKYKKMICVGLPTGFESFAWFGGNLVLIRLLNNLGTLAVGVYTVIFGIELIVYTIYLGIARAGLTLVGQKIGANNHKGAKKILSSCLKYDIIIVTLISIVFFAFSKNILVLFTKDVEIINEAVLYFRLVTIAIFPKSINVVVGNGIRGLGDTKWMLYTQLFGTVFIVSLAYILVYTVQLDILGVYIALLIDEIVRATINSIRFFKGRKYFEKIFRIKKMSLDRE